MYREGWEIRVIVFWGFAFFGWEVELERGVEAEVEREEGEEEEE